MLYGWPYRVIAVMGVILCTIGAVLFANHPLPQWFFTTHVPLFNRLDVTVLTGMELVVLGSISVIFVLLALTPALKLRSMRTLDLVFLVQKRVITAGLGLATLGFFKWSHRLPRATLVLLIGVLCLILPMWFIWIRQRPPGDLGRTVVVGDDRVQIATVLRAIDNSIVGYLAPPSWLDEENQREEETAPLIPDGGLINIPGEPPVADGTVEYLGGLSRLESVLVKYGIETAVLAFRRADRADFFGALDACYAHGVDVQVHRAHADSVLVDRAGIGPLVSVELQPWDVQDYVFKRLFDITFSFIGLVILMPVMMIIAVAIKLEDGGPILFRQERTTGFGGTFTIHKFRTMSPPETIPNPNEDESNDRITRTGDVLRRTHLDELPQLIAILTGKMSVVGPRAAWTDEELLIESETEMWRKRWFVKPGLTGLAQINGASSSNPSTKLRYDLEYIRRQSLWFDLKIVIRQLWVVLSALRASDQDQIRDQDTL